jgi:RNA polymerase sigma-70 factor, ECF subfamily
LTMAVPGTDVDDSGLVTEAGRGSREAYETLFERYRDGVGRTAYLLIGDPDLAQDVAQEAFLIGWRDLRRLRDPARFRAWVTGIAVNLCRKRRGSVRIMPGPPVSPTRAEPEPDAQTSEAEVRMAVLQAIGALPRRLREAVVLRYYGDLSETEMGAALGIPAGTVKSRLARARDLLAAALESLMEEE